MIGVLQIVDYAYVKINDLKFSQIKKGVLFYLGICKNDTKHDIEYMLNKFLNIKIWPKQDGNIGLPIKQINPAVLIVSEFTLCADIKHGSHVSFNTAMQYQEAKLLFEQFVTLLSKHIDIVRTGKFGANMKVVSRNKGPITIILNSKGYIL